jgi:hypothetical protein
VEPEQSPVVFSDETDAQQMPSGGRRSRWQWLVLGVVAVAALVAGIVLSAGNDNAIDSRASSAPPTPTQTVVVTAPAVIAPAPVAPTRPAPIDHDFTTEAPPGITPSILVGTRWALVSYAGLDRNLQHLAGRPPALAISPTGRVSASDGCNPISGAIDVTAIGTVKGSPARQFAFYGDDEHVRSCPSQAVVDGVLAGDADGVAEVVTATIRNGTLTLYRPGAGWLVYSAGTVPTG